MEETRNLEAAEALLLEMIPWVEHAIPPKGHEGSCTPETMCDMDCSDNYQGHLLLGRVRQHLARPAAPAQTGLREAAQAIVDEATPGCDPAYIVAFLVPYLRAALRADLNAAIEASSIAETGRLNAETALAVANKKAALMDVVRPYLEYVDLEGTQGWPGSDAKWQKRHDEQQRQYAEIRQACDEYDALECESGETL